MKDLPAGYNAVLPICQLCNRAVNLRPVGLTGHIAVNRASVGHAVRLAMNAARYTRRLCRT
jgi:hypothetical protein